MLRTDDAAQAEWGGALSPAELAEMNSTIDAHADMEPDEWRG